MTDTKKYYWLKLNESFFRDKKIKKLRRIAGGDTYTIIYLKMQLLSLKTGGKLFFEGVEDDFVEEIALDIDEEVDNVRVTVSFLMKSGLLEEVEEDSYILPQTIESIGSESTSAERVRRHRAKKKQALPASNSGALQCNATVTNSNTEIEIEIEKDIEKDIETNIQTDKEKEGAVDNSQLTAEDMERVELLRDLFDGWSVSDNQIFYLSVLIRDKLPYEIGATPTGINLRIYDNMQRFVYQARASDVKHIYGWLKKVIPCEDVY